MSKEEPTIREAFARHKVANAKAQADLAEALLKALPGLMQSYADYWNGKAIELYKDQLKKHGR